MKLPMVFLLLVLFFSSTYSTEQPKFSLDVSPINIDGKLKLKMRMKNTGDTPAIVFSGALPWVDGVSGARLFGFHGSVESGSRRLESMGSVSATFHSYNEVKIDAKSSIEGDIELEQRFPGINELSKRESIFLYWTYVPFDMNLTRQMPLEGAVFFERAR